MQVSLMSHSVRLIIVCGPWFDEQRLPVRSRLL
jgi:hypothetical protein